MRLELINHKDTWREEILPAFGLWYLSYFGNDPKIAKRNAYRKRVGMKTIIQEQTYIQVKISFGKRFLGFELVLQDAKLVP